MNWKNMFYHLFFPYTEWVYSSSYQKIKAHYELKIYFLGQ